MMTLFLSLSQVLFEVLTPKLLLYVYSEKMGKVYRHCFDLKALALGLCPTYRIRVRSLSFLEEQSGCSLADGAGRPPVPSVNNYCRAVYLPEPSPSVWSLSSCSHNGRRGGSVYCYHSSRFMPLSASRPPLFRGKYFTSLQVCDSFTCFKKRGSWFFSFIQNPVSKWAPPQLTATLNSCFYIKDPLCLLPC